MIKVDAMEKSAKMQRTKKDKVEKQKMNDDLKPQKAKKTFVKMPKMKREAVIPLKEYTEWRSILLPALGGCTWFGYKQISENPSDDDYQKIMSNIMSSPDLTDLLQHQVNIFDTSDGILKTVATCAAKVFEISAQKLVQNQTLPALETDE